MTTGRAAVTPPEQHPTGDTAVHACEDRLTWEDRLRFWLIEQDDALATSGAVATASDRAR